MRLVHLILAAAHVLAGAVWFGAMFYSLTVLHPKARSFFRGPRSFEDFIAHIAAGARWKVLGGAAFIGLTGVGLLLWPMSEHSSPGKSSYVAVKAALFVAAVSLFCFTSWVLWPARVMAAPEEIQRFQWKFKIIAIALLVLVGASMVIGVFSSHG